MLEGVDISLNGVNRDLPVLSSFDQQIHIVHSLGARHDLLSANEQVVGVGASRVLGARHGVEGSDGKRIFVHHVEVSAILVLDYLAQFLLLGGRQVLVIRGLHASRLNETINL